MKSVGAGFNCILLSRVFHSHFHSIRRALDPSSYYANILKACLEGVGTADERLVYTIVLQAEVNLANVKRSYMTLFGETLAADVAGDTSGDYEKTLLAIINGNA